MSDWSVQLSLLACAAALLAVSTASAAPVLKVGNASLSLAFDAQTGALVSVRNLSSRDEYLKDPGGAGNPFLIHVDPTVVPRAAADPGWWSGAVEDSLGGPVVAPGSCHVVAAKQGTAKTGAWLQLDSESASSGLRTRLRVTASPSANWADLTLSITNTGARACTVVTAFPHLSGLSLGPDRETNLGLMMASYGTPGVKGWANSGGWYGREVSMQWQAAYEPRLNEGVGVVVMDPELRPKLIRRSTGGVLSVLHYPGTPLAPGATYTYPTARMVVHRGSWRVVAQVYRDWFYRTFRPHKPPSWLRQVDLYSGNWIPSAEAVAKAKAQDPANGFTSYERMPLLYKDGPYDLLEWAMYNQGVQDAPETYGPYMGDGTYLFRSDLGGAAAMREGVRRLHAMGRRIMFYVAGNSILRSSEVLKGTRVDDWVLMDRPGHGYDIGYPNGFSVCPGYGPWQEQLARVARRILAETGADGIRLDELASFVPCFNPAHKHDNPYDSVRWLRDLTRKVRAAMDEVNPDAILLTEGALDAVHEACNGALQMFQPGRDIDAMRVAVPTYVGMAYHPGAVESALNGWIGGKLTARRLEWPWSHRGLAGRPAGYGEGPGPTLRWHELRESFPEAFADGQVTEADPQAQDAPNWVGRLWKGKRYWVMVGGNLDGSPLAGPVRVQLPELPPGVTHAYELDAATLQVRDAGLRRERGKVFLTVTAGLGAVLLPTPECPPLISVEEPIPSLGRGGEGQVRLSALGPWRSGPAPGSATASCPGLTLDRSRVSLPGEVRLRASADTEPGLYPLRVTGDCLPLKRWIRVQP